MWEQIQANKRKSYFLIMFMAALLILLGYGIGIVINPDNPDYAYIGVAIAVGVWLILLMTATWGGSGLLLFSSGAHEIAHEDHPRLDNVVEEMTIASGLPAKPKVYIIDSDMPNAFAVGKPEKAAVAVTSGLLMKLNRDELQGVIAHEIGHITNQDTRFMTLAGVMMGAIVILADMLLRTAFYSGRGRRRSSAGGGGQAAAIFLIIAIILAILAPLLAQMLYFACSRKREYLADASAARFTRYPEGLASALQKISRATGKMEGVNRVTAPMYIVNPLQSRAAFSLFSTHPSTGERVKILRSMAGGAAFANYEQAYSGVTRSKLIGAQTLHEDEPLRVRAASAEPEGDDLTRARETVDILHRLGGFLFLNCACGLRIKVPPTFKGETLKCPRCSREHTIPRAIAAAAAMGVAARAAVAQPEAVALAAAKAAADAKPRAEEKVFRRRAGRGESVRCDCGGTIQISPRFAADSVRCRRCGKKTRVVTV